jgi:RNA polymerase sigma-70 factor (ECF subfamily)
MPELTPPRLSSSRIDDALSTGHPAETVLVGEGPAFSCHDRWASAVASQMGSSATFEALRPHLMSVAYRMLGSAADAEDAVQDAWLRWSDVDEATIVTPKAWLSTALGRLCLDRLTSAHARRQSYVGAWLPEPVATNEPVDLESISLGFLLLLERLTPLERVAFILHRVFDHSHAEIARALGSTDSAVRQAFHRATVHVSQNRPRFAVSRESHERLLRSFLAAVSAGDVAEMRGLLVEDAVAIGDGGGKVRGAALKPVAGADRVARFISGGVRRFANAERQFEIRLVNGWPAVVGTVRGATEFVLNVETDGERIVALLNVINPDKLRLLPID